MIAFLYSSWVGVLMFLAGAAYFYHLPLSEYGLLASIALCILAAFAAFRAQAGPMRSVLGLTRPGERKRKLERTATILSIALRLSVAPFLWAALGLAALNILAGKIEAGLIRGVLIALTLAIVAFGASVLQYHIVRKST